MSEPVIKKVTAQRMTCGCGKCDNIHLDVEGGGNFGSPQLYLQAFGINPEDGDEYLVTIQKIEKNK